MVPRLAALDLAHTLVEWFTMLIVIRDGDRSCKLPPHSVPWSVGLVYLRRHDTLAPLAVGFGIPIWATTPVRRDLTPTQRTVNRALSTARAPVERGVAWLKSWRVFRIARCSPNGMSSIAAAVLTLERQR
ncbi:transposase family protein [Streptomyces sp. NPDC050982]|uniref:transposase family protein n=1 Tax=Streptomyces sp. NPDC050982 TaxID=3154746 RepID=UPI0033D02712